MRCMGRKLEVEEQDDLEEELEDVMTELRFSANCKSDCKRRYPSKRQYHEYANCCESVCKRRYPRIAQ